MTSDEYARFAFLIAFVGGVPATVLTGMEWGIGWGAVAAVVAVAVAVWAWNVPTDRRG